MGIGAEVIIKAIPSIKRYAELIIFGHQEILQRAAQVCGKSGYRAVSVIEPDGRLSRNLSRRACGQASLDYIEAATGAVQAGLCDALVTGPICKENIRRAGSKYPGHTEMLAGLVGLRSKTFLMMVGSRLRVSLVTLHEPLSRVPSLLSKSLLLQAIQNTHDALRDCFGIQRPRLAVAGFNPHAGEGGLFGKEEGAKIIPAVKTARRKGLNVSGPLPPDSVFYQALQGHFDAVVSLYHDQGLIPVKLLHFEDAVNMTLGLPFVRTSVDHGTAFDIAWQGKANPASLIAAGKLAARLARKKIWT